jgi:hypothetical protein
MKDLAIPLLVLVGLVAVAVVSAAAEVPEAAPTETPDLTATLDLVAPVSSTEAPDCKSEPALDLDGQEPILMFSNDCSIGCSTSNCQGVPRGNPCYQFGRGWGNCNLYLGYQCSDGTGWDCKCYGAGEAIP